MKKNSKKIFLYAANSSLNWALFKTGRKHPETPTVS